MVYIETPNISFGQNVTLYHGVHIGGSGRIVLGDNVAIGKDVIIFAKQEIIIGDNTSIAAQSYIIDCDHGTLHNSLIRDQPLISQSIYIGCDVWIGAGVKVLKGSFISEGAVIGAQSVVRGKVEPYSINVGIPIRKVSERK